MLRARKIQVVPETVATFFGNANLPASKLNPAILEYENLDTPSGLPEDDDQFFKLLKVAMKKDPISLESAVDEFASHLLYLLRYGGPERYIQLWKGLRLLVSSVDSQAKADIRVADKSGFIFLVQEDKRYLRDVDPEPQLIAEAIGCFQLRGKLLGPAGLHTAVILGITIVGTAPTFYKVDLTKPVVDAIEVGESPTQTTIVHKLIPPVDNPSKLLEEGMLPLNNRATILSCFKAFKQFVN
jgi:hypothetical protein